METKFFVKHLDGHNCGITQVGITYDGKYVISQGSDGGMIVWNVSNFNMVATIEQSIKLVFIENNIIKGIIHDGMYKVWNISLLKKLSEDYSE